MTAPATPLDALDSLDDAALQEVVRRANELLDERHHARRHETLEKVRGMLSEAGLSARDLITTSKKAVRKASGKSSGGQKESRRRVRYVHPDDPSKSWIAGRGRKPNWMPELDASGRKPIEVAID